MTKLRNTAQAFWALVWGLVGKFFQTRTSVPASPGACEAKTRVQTVKGKVPWVPRGLGEVKQPASDAAIKVHKAAVNALFARLEVEWIPMEYWELLAATPDPTRALRDFCNNFGLRVESLRREEVDEKAVLGQVIGVLLEMNLLGAALGAKDRAVVMRLLHTRRHNEAEALADHLRKGVELLAKIDENKTQIPFAGFEGFAVEIRKYKDSLGDLSAMEAEEALAVFAQFVALNEQYQQQVEACNIRIAWVLANWPTSTWATDNQALRDGIITAKENLEFSLANDEALDIEQGIGQFETISADLDAFIEEIKASHGASWSDPGPRKPDPSLRAAWTEALLLLGFTEDQLPTGTEVNKAFRKAAFQHHPDRHPGKEAQAAVMMIRLAKARQTLESGPPPT